jgi:hypothetical protein
VAVPIEQLNAIVERTRTEPLPADEHATLRPPDLTPSRFSESGLSFGVFSEGSEPFPARGAAVAGRPPGF